MIRVGDALEVLRTLPTASVRCCVTSPPYWGLRDYGVEGQLGLEPTPDEYVRKIVDVFREVRRVLANDGTLWLNLGDSYQSAKGASHGQDPKSGARRFGIRPSDRPIARLKPKDLVGIPWMVAFALRADGWYLRQEIIWHKPNPMPESVRDRFTKAHEQLFLLSKSPRYYWDSQAAQEPAVAAGRAPGNKTHKGAQHYKDGHKEHRTAAGLCRVGARQTRNRRDVWSVSSRPFKGAHFAVFPPQLVEPCVLAGSAPGDIVLDPFAGAGTVGLVCKRLGREHVGIDLNPEYAKMAEDRIRKG